jgi:transposase-like protein
MLTRNSQYYRTKNHYSYEEKMGMIQEYLTTEISMTQMVKKYHIGWSTIPKWMRNFGIPMPNEDPVQITMSEENKKQEKKDTVETLEAKLQELQAELDKEKLKNLALSTMIEVAEKELQIDIRKKSGAKQ